MSSALNSAVNRIAHLSQIRETTLEASVANAATGEVLHGSAAAYVLAQGRHSVSSRMRRGPTAPAGEGALLTSPTTTTTSGTNNFFDLSVASDREQLRMRSAINRRTAANANQQQQGGGYGGAAAKVPSTMPNRTIPAWKQGGVEGDGANTTTDAEAAAEAEVPTAPFPTKQVLTIIVSQILNSAPSIVFAALSPYIYGNLVGDLQTAGTVSSIATGGSMMLQVLLTPILSQIMDLYGRRKLAIFAGIKGAVVVIPLLIAGIVIHSGMADVSLPDGVDANAAKLGFLMPDERKVTFLKFLYGVFWALSLLASATSTSQSLVAIGDVCQSQQQRCAAIGVYAALAQFLAVFAVVGAQCSVLIGGAISVGAGIAGVIWAVLFFPETSSTVIAAAAAAANETASYVAAPTTADVEKPVSATVHMTAADHNVAIPNAYSSVSRRRTFYPSSQLRADRNTDANVVVTGASLNTTEAPPTTTTSAASYDNSRRLRVYVNPFLGIALIRKSKSAIVALGVLFTCLMAEISASDTLVYYLSITLDFTPQDVSYMQIEQAVLSVVACGVIGPIAAKYLSCARLCMLCSIAIVAALLVLALAKSTALIYAVYTPCVAFASVMMPSIAAVVTKDASTPEDVSLSMSTVMALVALLQAGGSFFAALIFKALTRDTLWVTFIISAVFTIPMFGLSVYLEIVCNREAATAAVGEGSEAAATADNSGTDAVGADRLPLAA